MVQAIESVARFSKVNFSSEIYLEGLKTDESASDRFSKALGTAPKNLFSNIFELAGFEKLLANSKALVAKRLRT